MERGTGVLCHISSLPGKYGIGGLGREAYRFAKLLKKSGVDAWQVLPLCQTGYGDSPYQSVSSRSGNPYFLDLEALKAEGLLKGKELKALAKKYKKSTAADYGALYEERYATLRTAFSRFHFDGEEFLAFIESGTQEEYALFMTAKSVTGRSFPDWEEKLKRHEPETVAELKEKHHEEYLFWQFLQFEFYRQWKKLKEYCNGLGLKIIGDLPLYVARDSADVWANPELFLLDERRDPEKVAGVPPDFFSDSGQLWGNPVYDWAANEREHFAHWLSRIRYALELYDLVRLDHFRGFDRYFEIPAHAETAREGSWREGPKDKLFDRLSLAEKQRIIAEDLGVSDENVRALLERTGFPGMKVLLFAFDGNPENPFLPHKYGENCVCYTGTHDNDTVAGYVKSLSSEEFILLRSRVAAELKEMGLSEPLGENPQTFARAFLAMALRSKAKLAVFPIQDVLGLDNSCRMNYPGSREGNWRFRLSGLPSAALGRLKKMIKKYRR